jgi:hypothetical protein
MPYTTDFNGNNRYTVDYQLYGEAWTNWVTAASHVASPYTTTITGLEQGRSYGVMVTYLDDDGVLGNNPQLIGYLQTPDYRTFAGWMTADASGSNAIDVTAPFGNDANGNGTVSIYYRRSDESSWKNKVSDAPHPQNPYVVKISGLAPRTSYDIRVIYMDPDGVYSTPDYNNAEQILYRVTTLSSKLIHNSQNANKKSHWSQYGGWGLPGTQYGEFTCLTCHSKRTTNASGIRTYIDLNPLPWSITPDSNWGGPVRFDGTGGTYGFGDDSVPRPVPPSVNRICEVCHTLTRGGPSQTPEHRKIQPAPASHNPPDCIRCHTHETGFKSPF